MFIEGLALHQQGYLAQAQALYQGAIKLQPMHFDALHLLGLIAYQSGNPALAVEMIDKAIQVKADSADAYINRGIALNDLAQHQAAIDSYDEAIKLRADYAEAYYNRGNALSHLKRYQAAIDSYDMAIRLKGGDAQAYNNRGVALTAVGEHQAAIDSYDEAIKVRADYAEAYNNRGNALNHLRQHQAAVDSYDKAIELRLDDAEAHNNRGIALTHLRQHQAAIDSYDKAIQFKADYAEAYYNRGNALNQLMQHQAAVDSYDKAVQFKADYAEAYNNRGVALNDLKKYQAAIDSYDQAWAIKPDFRFLFGTRLHTMMLVCDWRDVGNQVAQLVEKIQRNEKATPPFPVLTLSDSSALQRQAAEIWVHDKHPASFGLGNIAKRARHERIRIGYYSANYGNHAAGYLTAALYEQHDKDRFELIAFSFGLDQDDEIRKRIAAAFENFINVRDQSDSDIALLSRKLEIDIAVDLMGFTTDSRFGVFRYRAAPVQVNYLGYPGTTAADCIDYLVADKTLIPKNCQRHYREKIAYLPDSYLVSDANRRITDKVYTREELGLPEFGFVFCCFNNSHKITPDTFDGWMKILGQVDDSVLWLLEDNPTAAKNLRKEAEQRGMDAGRLVFAKRLPIAEHLARHRAADLFLDTLPCNAHTTASDALWAGLPVLTRMGEAFASRVAASLLNAIGVPELITTTQEQYESLAVELATNPSRFHAVKQKLARNRLTTPLFDTPLFTKHLEDAYTQMYEQYQADTPPQHIHVVGTSTTRQSA